MRFDRNGEPTFDKVDGILCLYYYDKATDTEYEAEAWAEAEAEAGSDKWEVVKHEFTKDDFPTLTEDEIENLVQEAIESQANEWYAEAVNGYYDHLDDLRKCGE